MAKRSKRSRRRKKVVTRRTVFGRQFVTIDGIEYFESDGKWVRLIKKHVPKVETVRRRFHIENESGHPVPMNKNFPGYRMDNIVQGETILRVERFEFNELPL